MNNEHQSTVNGYIRVVLGKKIVCGILVALVIFTFITDLSVGPARISFFDVVRALLQPASIDSQTLVIVRVIRLPIAAMAIIVGAALALAGMEMQTILNNSLASPYTLGISSAASFGAAIALIFGSTFLPAAIQNFTMPVFAFGFAIASSLLIYAIGKIKQDRNTIILSGIAVNFLFTALNSILHFFVNDQILRSLTNWSQGNILGATLQKFCIVFIVVAVTAPVLFRDSWKLTALCMGDDTASSLGVRVESLRTKVLVLSAVITSVAVCFVGTIGFVGLVAPYIAKALVGDEQRFSIPATLLTGALMLSVSSILSKSLIPDGQIPLGIITSIIGIPFLLILVLRGNGGGKS